MQVVAGSRARDPGQRNGEAGDKQRARRADRQHRSVTHLGTAFGQITDADHVLTLSGNTKPA